MKKIFSVFVLAGILGAAHAQVLNNSFETWTTKNKTVNIPGPGGGNQSAVFDDPANWSSSNLYPSTTRFGNNPNVIKDTANSYHLNASVRLRTVAYSLGGGPGGTLKVPGILVSGADVLVPASNTFGGNLNINNIPGAGFPISGFPKRFHGAYRLTNAGTDTISCYAQLKKSGTIVATALFNARNSTPGSNFVKFDVPFNYVSCQAPDTIILLFATAPINRLYTQNALTANTTLWVDSIGLDMPAGFAPVVNINARNDADTIVCSASKLFTVLTNDDTCGSNGIAMTISQQSPKGTATVVNNQINFVLNGGAPSGPTQVQYKICGNSNGCDSANLNIYVVNNFDARNDFDTLRCDSTKIIPVRANDLICAPNTDTLTVIQQPFGGVALVINNEIHFVKAPGAPYGNTTIVYALCDKSFSTCDTATVNFTSAIPVDAINNSDSLVCDTAKTINVKANDIICAGAQDSFYVVQQSNKGNAVFNGGNLTFTKNANATVGNTLIRYALCDKVSGKCDSANVTLFVGGFVDAVNDFATVACDTFIDVDVLLNDYVCPSLADTLFISQQSNAGVASIVNKKVRFVKNANATNGNSIIRYYLCNSAKTICDSANIQLTVNVGNINARNDLDTVTCLAPKTISVLNNDSKSCVGSYDSLRIFTPPVNGTAVVNGSQIIYTPSVTAAGVQRFVYRLCDSFTKQCDTASVFVNVLPIATHSAATDSVTLSAKAANFLIAVMKNDNPVSCANTKKVSIKTAPLNGTATVSGDTAIQYTPNTLFIGTDVFDYYLCNQFASGNICDSAKVVVSVINVLSIDNPSINAKIAIWPNPTSDILHISADQKILAVDIINAKGQLSFSTLAEGEQIMLSTAKIPAGNYILNIKTAQGVFSQRVILSKQ